MHYPPTRSPKLLSNTCLKLDIAPKDEPQTRDYHVFVPVFLFKNFWLPSFACICFSLLSRIVQAEKYLFDILDSCLPFCKIISIDTNHKHQQFYNIVTTVFFIHWWLTTLREDQGRGFRYTYSNFTYKRSNGMTQNSSRRVNNATFLFSIMS